MMKTISRFLLCAIAIAIALPCQANGSGVFSNTCNPSLMAYGPSGSMRLVGQLEPQVVEGWHQWNAANGNPHDVRARYWIWCSNSPDPT
jgi:hypothetical protein